MKFPSVAALCTVGLMLSAAAGAETYRVLGGAMPDAHSGASEPLRGMLEVSVFEPEGQDVLPSLLVDDFQLEAGARSFGPQQPVEFEGRSALWVQLANQIQFDGDAVGLVHLRSGGDLIAADENELTYRFVDFRSDGSRENRLIGHLADSLLPRRISLSGEVYEVDQHFLIPRGDCPVVPLPPGDGGGVIIGGGDVTVVAERGDRTITFQSFDIAAEETVVFQTVDPGRAVIPRVTGGARSSIEGNLEVGGAVAFLDPSRIVFDGTQVASPQTAMIAMATAPAPTLDELGITAPSGTEVTFDELGALSVVSPGDLLVEGGSIDVPGMTSLTLVAAGTIRVEGPLEVPPGVTINLQAAGVVFDGELTAPDEIVIEPRPPLPFCTALRAVFPPEERLIGNFTLVASAARQVEVDVEPKRRVRVLPRLRGLLSVAILGSADFDIRDVQEDSLRLGPGEAGPVGRRGRRIDANRDGETDLLVRFDAQAADIVPDDAEICLFGETRDGVAIEGCDAIERRPPRRWGRSPEVGSRKPRLGADPDSRVAP